MLPSWAVRHGATARGCAFSSTPHPPPFCNLIIFPFAAKTMEAACTDMCSYQTKQTNNQKCSDPKLSNLLLLPTTVYIFSSRRDNNLFSWFLTKLPHQTNFVCFDHVHCHQIQIENFNKEILSFSRMRTWH